MGENENPSTSTAGGCAICRERGPQKLGFDFTMAFQPIIDLPQRRVFAREALVRGTDGSGAGSVLSQVTTDNRYAFDQRCRVKAIEEAARLGVEDAISINFMPNAIYEPSACIRTTLLAAARHNWPVERIIFEFTEAEQIDPTHLQRIFEEYRRIGFKVAIDDFGAGFSGLRWLADLKPDIVKLDMELIRHVDADPRRRAIVASVVTMCDALGAELIAEGVETPSELEALQDVGATLFQGYLFARPTLGAPADITWPPLAGAPAADLEAPHPQARSA
ncbi:MAG: EAL domain-containing protein [Pseudomonadota bacterium]